MDTEFAVALSYIHNKQFKLEAQTMFVRGAETWLERVARIRQWAVSEHMLVKDLGNFRGIVMWSEKTTRRKPACIRVVPIGDEPSEGARYNEFLGVCQYEIVEKGFVRLDQASENSEVWAKAEGGALQQ